MVNIGLLVDSLASNIESVLVATFICLFILYTLLKIFSKVGQSNEENVKVEKLCQLCEQSSTDSSVLYKRFYSNATSSTIKTKTTSSVAQPLTSLRNKFYQITSTTCNRCGTKLNNSCNDHSIKNNQERRFLDTYGKLFAQTELVEAKSSRQLSPVVVHAGLTFEPNSPIGSKDSNLLIRRREDLCNIASC